MIRRTLTLHLILFLIGFFLIAELLLRVVVPACELPPMELNEEYGFLYYRIDSELSGQFTQGQLANHRSNWMVNNDGWIFPEPYLVPEQRQRPLIALFGSSYIEGIWVEPEQNPALRLRENLDNNYDVYNFSITNSVPSEHLVEARYVRDVYDPDIYVFIMQPGYLIGSTDADAERTRFSVNADTVSEIPPTIVQRTRYDGLKQLVRKSALVRYLVWNLRLASALRGSTVSDEINAITVQKTVYDDSTYAVATRVAHYLCHRMSEEHPGKLLVIAHGDIYSSLDPPTMDPEGRIIQEIAPQYGIQTIYLTDGFHQEYVREQRPFRFSYDMHWNAYALSVLADIIGEGLQDILPSGYPEYSAGDMPQK